MLPDDSGPRFVLPVATFYGALFIVYGTYVPFMPVWLDYRGLTANEISVVIAAPLFLRAFVTPVFAVASDRGGDHRRYLVLLAWAAVAFVLVLAASRSFSAILIFAVLLTVCNSTSMPLIDTVAVRGARVRGLHYGRLRLWGSLSFVAASFIGGLAITAFGGEAGIWLIAVGCALTLIAAYKLPDQGQRGSATGAGMPSLWKATEVRELLACREFQLFLVAGGFVQAAHAAFFTFGTLLWQKQGLSAAWCGTLWAIGVFAEVLLFSFSSHVAEKFGPVKLITIGSAASILRWLALANEPSLLALVPLQLLHGVTYGASHIGAMHFIHDAVPRDKSASAQALYATVSAGVAMGVATLTAGYIYARAGAASYLAMAVIAAIALSASLRLMQIWSGGLLASRAERLAP